MLESLADNFKGNTFLNLCQAILSLVIMLKELVSLDQEADRKETNWHVHLSKTSLSIKDQIISSKVQKLKKKSDSLFQVVQILK